MAIEGTTERNNLHASEKFPSPENYLKNMEERGLTDCVYAYKKVLEFAQIVKENNGQALLVGGSVRDTLMGKIPKDFDLEIYGLEPVEIERIVRKIGKVSEVGRAFGILKIFLDGGMEIDVSLPRTDSKINVGHRGFEVKTNPYMSIEEAAKRRDFTMNSIAADPLTGELYDPFNGVVDIRNRVLKVTDEERFGDDSLRVLRAMQFIGRFGLEIDKDSVAIIQAMVPQLKELPKERIGEEWKKLLLKSEKPSLGLIAGMMFGVFREIHPQFPPLVDTQQEPNWHPEGNVWIHTLMVVDEAAKIINNQGIESEKALTVLLAALCHDLGKPSVTDTVGGRIISHGHEQAGEEPTKIFLATIGIDSLTRDKVVKLVTEHLAPTMLFVDETVRGRKVSDGTIRRLSQRLFPATIQELVLVSNADHLGRGSFETEVREQLLLPVDQYPAGEWLLERSRKLGVELSRPADIVRGKDWLSFGFKAGPEIGKLIKLANQLRDEKDFSREMVLECVFGLSTSEEAIAKLQLALE